MEDCVGEFYAISFEEEGKWYPLPGEKELHIHHSVAFDKNKNHPMPWYSFSDYFEKAE